MVESQIVIERSIYSAILNRSIALGHSLDPEDYLPLTEESKLKFNTDKGNIEKNNKPFISIFGSGTNNSKGEKLTPRIVLAPKGFYPGDVGLPKFSKEKDDTGKWLLSEFPFEAIHQIVDVHVVANNISDLRLLQSILHTSLPQRGYIKPHYSPTLLKEGNIYLELVNFARLAEGDTGIMENVYSFEIRDTLLEEVQQVDEVSPIKDISILLEDKVIIHKTE